MFRYVDVLCLLPLYMYPKTHTLAHAEREREREREKEITITTYLQYSATLCPVQLELDKHCYHYCVIFIIQMLRQVIITYYILFSEHSLKNNNSIWKISMRIEFL